METLLKYIANATRVISWITFRKVLLLALAAIVGITTYTLFEQREKLSMFAATKGTGFTISVEMQDRIRLFVNTSPIIIGAEAHRVELKTNERTLVHQYIDDPELNLWITEYVKRQGVVSPVFTTNSNLNAQMVSVINGEFTCLPLKESNIYTELPQLGKKIATVCKISLPPYYGEFSGYLSVFLNKSVDADEQKEVELALKRIANEIFYKNIVAR